MIKSRDLICVTYDTLTTGIVVQDKSGVNIDVDLSVRVKRGLTAAGLRPVYETWPVQIYRADTTELIHHESLGEGYLQFAENESELLVNHYKNEYEAAEFTEQVEKTLKQEPY